MLQPLPGLDTDLVPESIGLAVPDKGFPVITVLAPTTGITRLVVAAKDGKDWVFGRVPPETDTGWSMTGGRFTRVVVEGGMAHVAFDANDGPTTKLMSTHCLLP